MAIICCWRSGECEVKSRPVDGALTIMRGPKARLERALLALARHAYDGETLLVPGVPEADCDDEALKAVFEFQTMLERCLIKRQSRSTKS